MIIAHSERKHAKYSASSFDRLEGCPGSATLSEGLPDKSSPWAEEGTTAHEAHEALLNAKIDSGTGPRRYFERAHKWTDEMMALADASTDFIYSVHTDALGSDILVETRVDDDLEFIDPDVGGTFDGAVIEMFGTLHVFDYKYGAGHAVAPERNLQMIVYAIGLAKRYGWNFKRIRMWIIQPRIRGYDGPTFWEIPTMELKEIWLSKIQEIVDRANANPTLYSEGGHCHWCKAKKICPLKIEGRNEKAKSIFKPVGGDDGSSEKENEEVFRSEADWRKGKARKGAAQGQAREKETGARAAQSARLGRGGSGPVDFF